MILPYKAILFDLDGTLTGLSLDRKIENAGMLFASKFRVNPQAIERAYRTHSGIPRRQLFEQIAKDVMGRSLSESEFRLLSEEFTRRNIRALRELPFVEGASALLGDLAAAGVFLAVSSSADPVEVNGRLAGLHDRLFDEIMGSHREFQKGRAHIEYIAECAGCAPREMLMVGDEPPDLYLAREAGAKVALVAQTRPLAELAALLPDILVLTLADLRQYVLPAA